MLKERTSPIQSRRPRQLERGSDRPRDVREREERAISPGGSRRAIDHDGSLGWLFACSQMAMCANVGPDLRLSAVEGGLSRLPARGRLGSYPRLLAKTNQGRAAVR